MRKLKKSGFTLIELLAVIVILGLLLGLAIPAISNYIGESRQDTYSLHEADMKAAAANKMTQCVEKNTVGCVPQSGESRTIYLTDLIDMEVYNENDDFIGVVTDIREYPQCYYLVVKGKEKNHLIPFIKEFVVDITDVIIIHEMEGLLS